MPRSREGNRPRHRPTPISTPVHRAKTRIDRERTGQKLSIRSPQDINVRYSGTPFNRAKPTFVYVVYLPESQHSCRTRARSEGGTTLLDGAIPKKTLPVQLAHRRIAFLLALIILVGGLSLLRRLIVFLGRLLLVTVFGLIDGLLGRFHLLLHLVRLLVVHCSIP